MIRINVSGVSATVTEKEILTAGRVGLECAFTFTGEWDGLFKTAVFQGVESVDVALPDNTCVVPWEAMQVEGVQLKIGVFGANGEGTIVIPTVWTNAGKIQPSAIGGGAEPSDPSQNANAYAVETAEEAKNIALSVQQRADNGEFDGADGFSPSASVSKVGFISTITITDKNGTTTAQVRDGLTGPRGTDGVSPSALVSKVGNTATITITDENGTTTAVIHDGPRGPAGQGVPAGGTTGQVLKKASGTDYDAEWADESGGGAAVEPYTSTPAALGTASAGSSDAYARGDHVHQMPTASQVGAYELPSGGIPKTDLASALSSEITQNTEDVADLKSAFYDGEKIVSAFLQGRYNTADFPKFITQADRISTPTFYVRAGDKVIVSAPATGQSTALGGGLPGASTLTYDSGWQTTTKEYTPTNDLVMFVCEKNNDGTNISPSDASVNVRIIDQTSVVFHLGEEIDQTNDTVFTLARQNISFKIPVESGYWTIADGSAGSSTTWCRTKGFLGKNDIIDISTATLYLLAYNSETGAYVGAWNGSGFSTTYNPSLSVHHVDVSDWLENYPNYIFKLDFKGASTITPSDVYANMVVSNSLENELKDYSDESIIDYDYEIRAAFHGGDNVYTEFKQGRPKTDTNVSQWVNISSRCATPNLFVLYAGDTITVSNTAEGQKYGIGGADSMTGSLTYDSGWKTAEFTYTASSKKYMWVGVAKSDGESDITPSEITSVITVKNLSMSNVSNSIIKKYREQIANSSAGADYYRGAFVKNFSLLMVSDNHQDFGAVQNAVELSEGLPFIDGILHLGDTSWLTAIPASGVNPFIAEYDLWTKTKPFYCAIGNHDEQDLADSTAYGTVAQGVSGLLAHINTSSIYNQRGYGYTDIDDYGIRLIILNCFDYPDTTTSNEYDFYGDYLLFQQAQAQFFADTLASVPTDYTVIVACHYCELANIQENIIHQHGGTAHLSDSGSTQVGFNTFMSDVVMSDIIKAYKERSNFSKSYSYTNGTVSGNYTVEKDFTSAKGTFALWVSGHRHRSCVATSSVGDYLVYVNDTSYCGDYGSAWATSFSNTPRSMDNNTRDLLTCLSIDTANKYIKLTRIGAHINRFLDDENLVCLSYGD